jgi:serine/threonine protein kinase
MRMSQKEREQLHAEFQILSHLRHPNIVAYYHREHLKLSQDLHLYMEYCGNGDLGRVIKDLQHKKQHAQESFVWSIFSQLVSALYRCHYGVDPPSEDANVLGLAPTAARRKAPAGTVTILHRDLKPENVFLGHDNSVKLGDFGLSKMIKSHDFASTYVGTPFYMSPEICAAEKYTLKSDIWSLGCIMYELCCRVPPFNAKTHFQLVQKIKEGKVAPLPEVYSPELNQVIKDCLKVNPDRRPDTAQLLNLPAVRLMRKETEVAVFSKTLAEREEAVRKREQELSERLASLESERAAFREDVDASLRREWEVKARLEIDRRVNAEIEELQKRFEAEVMSRVEAELARKASLELSDDAVEDPRSDYPLSSVGTSGDEFPSMTDITDYSLNSPESSKETKKLNTRTPFARAQTMFVGHAAGTPMDIEMASPSPMAIASLSLSPRRNGATKAPSTYTGNIFAVHASSGKAEPKWDLPRDLRCVESDDEEDLVPSPTRQVKSSKNPFTARDRPVLTSQKSAPINRLKPQQQSGNTGFVSKSVPPVDNNSQNQNPRSANRRLSKIPSVATLSDGGAPTGGLTRKSSLNKKDGGDALGKVAAKNNIRGRTLVELQQARAGGRPLSCVGAPGTHSNNTSPKRAFRDRLPASRRSSGDEPVAVWDPERDDDMPSPFLVRRVAKV